MLWVDRDLYYRGLLLRRSARRPEALMCATTSRWAGGVVVLRCCRVGRGSWRGGIVTGPGTETHLGRIRSGWVGDQRDKRLTF